MIYHSQPHKTFVKSVVGKIASQAVESYIQNKYQKDGEPDWISLNAQQTAKNSVKFKWHDDESTVTVINWRHV